MTLSSTTTTDWNKKLSLGMDIEVSDTNGTFLKGTIVEFNGDNIKVHYNHFAEKYDEWIDIYSKRLFPLYTHLLQFQQEQNENIRFRICHFYNHEINKHFMVKASRTNDTMNYYQIQTNNSKSIKTHHYSTKMATNVIPHFYPYLSSKNSIFFIDVKNRKIFEWNNNKQKYIDLKVPSLQQIPMFGHKKTEILDFQFIINDEIHFIYGNPKRFQKILHHIKYIESKNIFIQMDDIKHTNSFKFNPDSFIYNKSQKRLYMILLNEKFISISYLQDMNEWENKWRIDSSFGHRNWIQIDIKIPNINDKIKYDKYRLEIVYDSMLMVVIRNNLIWIDLNDFEIVKSDKYLAMGKYREIKHVINTFDDYIHIINSNGKVWYKLYLPQIIPDVFYIKNNVKNKKFISEFMFNLSRYNKNGYIYPLCLNDLICCFYPVFLY